MFTISRRGNLAETLLAAGTPDSPALLAGRQQVRRYALRATVRGWSAWLRAERLELGERVGIFSQNSPFFVAAYLGIIHAGGCAVPLPIDCTEKMFERIVASVAMRRMFVSAQCEQRVLEWAERLGVELILESAEEDISAKEAAAAEVDLDRALAAIMFTSGSTGEPKGATLTHRNILVNTQDILGYTGIAADDRVMVVLPFSYCYGMSLLHTHLMAGGSLVLNNRFLFPEKVLDEMVETACTGLAGVPATYQMLLRKTRFAERKFPALRWLQQAGGKLPSPLILEIRKAFPHVHLFIMYGQTEATARLSYLPPDRLDDKLGSIGRGLPHTRLDVLRPDGTPVTPGSDDVGEIVASGENIAIGYWNDPAETQKFFRDGKLYTGDMARVDKDGFLFIVERARNFIKSMGYRISPQEIEEVLAEMPEIVEAAVIGVPDDLCGEAIKVYIVAARSGSLTAEDVTAHCLQRLPNYKIPKSFEFLPQLPKLSNGKLDRAGLKAGTAGCHSKPATQGRP